MIKQARLLRGMITAGHFAADFCQGAIASIFPFLIIYNGIGYAQATALLMASSIVSSVLQPLVGIFSDKYNQPILMALGVTCAAAGITLVGFTDNYIIQLLLCGLMGVGVALFHPEGAKLSNYLAGSAKAKGIGIFAVGGNIGFVLAPVVATASIELWGMPGLLSFLVISLPIAAYLFVQSGRLRQIELEHTTTSLRGSTKTELAKSDGLSNENLVLPRQSIFKHADITSKWGDFGKISLILVLRSVLLFALRSFIPMFLITVFMVSVTTGNIGLIVYSIASAVATLGGSFVSEKLGYRKMIIVCSLLTVPAIALFVISPNIYVAMLLLVVMSLALNSSYGPSIALAQSYLPNHLGLASGISLGLAISVGGLFAPLLGAVGDSFGLTTALWVLVGIAAVVLLVSLWLRPDDSDDSVNYPETRVISTNQAADS